MNGLELTRRHCSLGVVVVFGVMLAEPLWLASQEIPYRRMALPVLAVLLYAFVAAAVGRRRATVRPEGVEIRVRPLPFGPAIRIGRETITAVYTRDYFDLTRQVYEYAVGVLEGDRRTDVWAPMATKELAGQAAADIARILNAAPGVAAVPVIMSDERHGDPRRTRRMLAWLALLALAVLAGAIWESRK